MFTRYPSAISCAAPSRKGCPPEMLQKILGHADYSSTANIYTHIDAETLVSAVTDALLTRQEKGKKKKP